MKIDLNKSSQIIKGPDGIKLILESSEIFPNDPGQGTPCLVALDTGDTATFNCVDSELEVDGIELTTDQQTWIRQIGDDVDSWLSHWISKVA